MNLEKETIEGIETAGLVEGELAKLLADHKAMREMLEEIDAVNDRDPHPWDCHGCGNCLPCRTKALLGFEQPPIDRVVQEITTYLDVSAEDVLRFVSDGDLVPAWHLDAAHNETVVPGWHWSERTIREWKAGVLNVQERLMACRDAT